jgi:hypothetical protein
MVASFDKTNFAAGSRTLLSPDASDLNEDENKPRRCKQKDRLAAAFLQQACGRY